MSNSSFLLGLSILILAAGAILLAISRRRRGRLWPWGPLCPSTGGGCPQEGDSATLLCPQGDGQGKQQRRWRQRFWATEPCNAGSSLCGHWRCRPGCTDCIKAAQELQELVLSAWAGRGDAVALDAGTWQALWQDLEELVEQDQLSCCSSHSYPESISPSGNLTGMLLTPDGGTPKEGDGQGKQQRRWRRRFRATEPCNTGSPLCGPWCCRPGCNDCIKAAQELQELVLSAWAGRGDAATLDAGTWQALWQDLEELVEQDQLSCCSSPRYPESISPPGNLTGTLLTQVGRAPMEVRSPCFYDHTCADRVSSALKMHMARKALEIRMGALPGPVQQSQEQAAQQQGCLRVLPKLTLPGQSQHLRRYELCPPMQAKENAIVDNNKDKEVQRLWGDPNPTEDSMALLMLGPPPLHGPLDPKLPKESRAGEPRAPGNASAVGQQKAGLQEPQSSRGSEEKPAIRAPEEDTLRKSLLHLGRGLSPWDKECLLPFNLATAQPPLAGADKGAAGPEARPASMLLKKDAACQTNVPTKGTVHDHSEDRSWSSTTAPISNKRLQLNQKVHSKLWIHTARKCLEIKLQIVPKAVQRSMGMLRCSLPRLRQAGAGQMRPHKGSAHVAKAKQLRQKEWVLQEQVQASLNCTVVPMTPCSCLDCVSSYSPVPGKESSQAFLEARTLPCTSCSSANQMGTEPKNAPRTPCGMVKDSPGPAPTCVSPSLVPAFPAMDTKPEKAQGAHMCSTHEGFMARAPGAPESHCGCCKKQVRPAGGSFPSGIAPLESTTRRTSRERSATSKLRGSQPRQDGQKCWSSRRQSLGSSESSLSCGTWSEGTSGSTETQSRWTPDSLSEGSSTEMTPTSKPCCPEGIPSQHSPSSQQQCGSPVTRKSCQPCPAQDTQDTAAASTSNTLRAVLEKIRQRRRKVSSFPESSSTECSCHSEESQGQASQGSSSP